MGETGWKSKEIEAGVEAKRADLFGEEKATNAAAWDEGAAEGVNMEPKRGGGRHPCSDLAVRGTNDDASASKASCVARGYLKDPFAQHFVRRVVPRPPLINRGYFARVHLLQRIVRAFLDQDKREKGRKQRQVVSLGAGYDTSYFVLQKDGVHVDKYVEVDFHETATKKASVIRGCEDMMRVLGEETQVDANRGRVSSHNYCLLPADLRNIDQLNDVLTEAGVDTTVPTLVLAECVLVYVEPEDSLALMKWAVETFPCNAFLLYDMINGNDPFGQQMIYNLEKRGIPLPGLIASPTADSYRGRLCAAGYARAQAADMNSMYASVDPTERARIERLEILDELEEWQLIMGHYCIAYGINDSEGVLKDIGFDG